MSLLRSGELVGRDAEWRTGLAALDGVEKGHGGLLVLAGEPGIGKSRLAADLAEQAAARGTVVLRGRAVRGSGAQPYRPLAGAASQALRTVLPDGAALDGTGGAVLRAGLAALLPGLVTGPRVALSPLLVAETMLRLARTADAGAGVLTVLEDLHWADSETLAVLDYLADYLHEEPLLVLATTRTDEGAGVRWDEWERHPDTTVLRLGRLGPADVRRLARACSPDHTLPDDVVEMVVSRSDGIPFLVEELLANSSGAVPLSFAHSVATRLGELGRPAADVLQAASVLGRDVDWSLVRDAVGLSDSVVLDALAQAIRWQLIEEVASGHLRFRHTLTTDAIRATMPRPRLVELAAQLLDRLLHHPVTADRVALCAELALVAGRPEEASRHLVAQAESALAGGAVSTALTAARRARDLVDPGTPVGISATWVLVRALDAAGHAASVDRLGTRLLEIVESRPDTAHHAAELQLVLARAAARAMDLAGARQFCESALRTAHLDRELELRLRLTLAEIAFDAQEHDTAVRHAHAVLAEAEHLESAEIACSALELLGRYHMLVAHELTRGRRYLGEELRRARRAGLDLVELRALHQLAHLDIALLRGSASLDEASALAERIGGLTISVDLEQLRAVTALTAHRLDRAEECGRSALAASRRYQLGEQSAVLTGVLATVDAMQGRAADAARRIDAELAERQHSPHIEAAIVGAPTVFSALVVGDLAAALGAVQRTRELLPRHDMIVQPFFLGMFHAVAAVVVAASGAEELVVGRDWVDIDDSFMAGSFAVARAIVAGRRGDAAGAEQLFTRGDAELAGAPWIRAVFRRHAAEAALSDRWGDPQRMLAEAAEVFIASGDHRLARSTAALAVPAAPFPDLPELTSRESDVLSLVSRGMTNQQIADRLFLSPRTVEKHVERLRAKTGTANRTELAALALTSAADRGRDASGFAAGTPR